MAGGWGIKRHSTSRLFLQRFVESEREFLKSLFLTNRSTFVLHGIPFSESLLVSSSIICISFFSLARAFYSSARVTHLRCNCHHCSGSFLTTSVAPYCYYGFYRGGLGVNGNLLNYPETVTPYHYNWAPLGGGAYELRPPSKGA